MWPKACILRSIAKIDGKDMPNRNPHFFSVLKKLSGKSLRALSPIDTDIYLSASRRIPDSVKTRLDMIINGTKDGKEYIFEKMQFLADKSE